MSLVGSGQWFSVSKKAIFRFKKSEIPFRFRFIIGYVEFDDFTLYRKKVRWTDHQNGTISAVNWRKGHN